MTNKALFKIGDVLRYANGSTALFKVDHFIEGYGGNIARYWGRQFFGSAIGAYHEDCRLANEEEVKLWNERAI